MLLRAVRQRLRFEHRVRGGPEPVRGTVRLTGTAGFALFSSDDLAEFFGVRVDVVRDDVQDARAFRMSQCGPGRLCLDGSGDRGVELVDGVHRCVADDFPGRGVQDRPPVVVGDRDGGQQCVHAGPFRKSSH